ncbi:S-formylglutathione hydrolase [Planctomycetales bacterium ZRK34]|nr:S-formylglutathione hydrolase [Planctomycetales bacterium ZRK34]
MERVSRNRSFGGFQDVYRHASQALGCGMNFGVYLPPAAERGACPVLYWLSGLTCTEQNFITKAGAQRYAAEHGVILVAPDTSPRGDDVADDEGYDLGQGAGFYLNAARKPWAKYYRMEDYVTGELAGIIEAEFNVTDKRGVCGHSMGGHGALTLFFRHPGMYQSVSALSPIVAPTQVPWGHKAFGAYLGDDRSAWAKHDATELVMTYEGPRSPILIDQGEADQFLTEQLRPELFEEACRDADYPLTLRRAGGYDHSYYFVASFIGDHIAHHAATLCED